MSVLDELDWRREVTRLYAAVRAERSSAAAHGGWVTARERLLAEHPCSPAVRDAFSGLEVPDHDRSWRVEVPVLPAPPRDLPGPVPGEQVGVLPTPWGDVAVWRLRGHGGGIWIAVRDRGSGRLSSSGGRVLYDTACGVDLGTGPDGGLVVDLNFLHAPDSAHDPRRVAPQLPPDLVLDVVVPVGELLPGPPPGLGVVGPHRRPDDEEVDMLRGLLNSAMRSGMAGRGGAGTGTGRGTGRGMGRSTGAGYGTGRRGGGDVGGQVGASVGRSLFGLMRRR